MNGIMRSMQESQQLTFPPPPRRVRRSVSSGCSLAFLRLFVLPHTLIGIGILAGPAQLYTYYFGKPVTAVVDRSELRRGKKNNTTYHLTFYHYTIDGVRVDAQMTSPPKKNAGETFEGRAVRILQLGEFIPVPSPIWRTSLFFMCIALFWNGILSLFLYGAWIVPIQQRRLARYGEVAIGTVTLCERKRSKGASNWLHYAFQTPEQLRYSGKATATRTQCESIPVGAPITVFYKARNPTDNLAYEVSDFIVSDDSMG